MVTATQTDYLKENASNIWFVLGAYFFAFFPWAVMNNVDFISEKWRTCRRTRKMAHTHLALSIFPIVYVAVYAEAQRRDADNKELGAALAALMFNVFQLMRTLMGLLQLNAFVAWCKHAVDCMKALDADEYEAYLRFMLKSAGGRGRRGKRRITAISGQWQNMVVSWWKRGLQCIRRLVWRCGQNGEEHRNGDGENNEPSVNVNGGEQFMGALPGIRGESRDKGDDGDADADESEEHIERTPESSERDNDSNTLSSMGLGKVDDENENCIEDVVMVNNMVVDNELWGREVTVLPSWVKIWRGLKKRRFTPRRCLRTDRVILNTVRWGAAYLCGMGRSWCVPSSGPTSGSRSGKECGELLESFFSSEMEDMRNILQRVEWNTNLANDGREFLSIHESGADGIVALTGEMSTAYGNPDTGYNVRDTYAVDSYSFEFNSLVGSYPASNAEYSSGNREKIGPGLVHSMLLAKHLGVKKLKAMRQYYDRQRVPDGANWRNAIKLLLLQTDTHIPDEAKIWEMFESSVDQIPIFPYQMQMVALWDNETNWHVLQASAHQDILNSLFHGEERVLQNAPFPVNIFDSCAQWTFEQIGSRRLRGKGSLGILLETVRTFLAEWTTASSRSAWQPNWEPEIPSACIVFNTRDITEDSSALIWICQRELQRMVAQMSREEEKFAGSAALIMLFILGFPHLKVQHLQPDEVGIQNSQDEPQQIRISLSSSTHRSVNLSVEVWRAGTCLSPQDISLIIRVDSDKSEMSLRLQNDSGDARFIWQDWVDAAMGSLKGFEEGGNGEKGYGRKIVRADLRKPIVELCPLHVTGNGDVTRVVRMRAVRIWMGWLAFDVGICKFEVDQLLNAYGVYMRDGETDTVIESMEKVIETMMSSEKEGVEATRCGKILSRCL